MSLLRGGRRALDEDGPVAPITVCGLLGRADAATGRLDVYVPPSWLADLHDPRLIITADFVGRDRRFRHRHPPSSSRPDVALPSPSEGRGSSLRFHQLLAVVVATVALVVPLTLMASHPSSGSAPAQHPLRVARPAAATDVAAARRPARATGIDEAQVRRLARQPTRTTDRRGSVAVAASTTAMAMSPGCDTARCARQRVAADRRAQRGAREAARAARRGPAATT